MTDKILKSLQFPGLEDTYIIPSYPIEEGTQDTAIIMNNLNTNEAIANYTMAAGIENRSGIYGYRLLTVNINEDGTRNLMVEDANLEIKARDGYQIGDNLCFDGVSHYYDVLTISALEQDETTNNSIITISLSENTPEPEKVAVTDETGEFENWVWVLERPYCGVPMLGSIAAFTAGYTNIAIGLGATSFGADNQSIGSTSFTEGMGNKALYCAHAEGRDTKAIGYMSHSEGTETIASGYGSHSEGFSSQSIGAQSHAEGSKTTASGAQSHAEGNSSTASGNQSHSEGIGTKAIGLAAHAEGNKTEASGASSHAEGQETVASSTYAHAEGFQSKALGSISHAEGRLTEASGAQSHAEGHTTKASGYTSHAEGRGTIAAGKDQHVQGTFNIEDTENKYAHIVGAGTNNENRKNIHTIDWEGNAHFAGDVRVGENNDKLITNSEFEYFVQEDLTNQLIDLESQIRGQIEDVALELEEKTKDFVKGPIAPGTGPNSLISNDLNNNKASGASSFASGWGTTASGSSAHAEGWGTLANGDFSHAEGDMPQSSGYASHAEGGSTDSNGTTRYSEINESTTVEVIGSKAYGDYSHAENIQTLAYGKATHAEGYATDAIGDYSHAEGYQSASKGIISHAEGRMTKAVGNNSHAEGNTTEANGVNAHAEGYLSIATGNCSHSEGRSSQSIGVNSHAEGLNTIANESNAHAEGELSEANGIDSHAEGYYAKANGYVSHAEGYHVEAAGNYSHAEGYSTTANDYAHAEGLGTSAWLKSHAEGESTQATGVRSHAEGNQTIASGDDSHAEGNQTEAQGLYSHAENYMTKAIGNMSHAEGHTTEASKQASHSEGRGTIANSNFQHVQGKYNIADTPNNAGNGTYAHIVGNGTSDTARSNAHTLDWSGNAWFAGDIFVGAEAYKLAKSTTIRVWDCNEATENGWYYTEYDFEDDIVPANIPVEYDENIGVADEYYNGILIVAGGKQDFYSDDGKHWERWGKGNWIRKHELTGFIQNTGSWDVTGRATGFYYGRIPELGHYCMGLHIAHSMEDCIQIVWTIEENPKQYVRSGLFNAAITVWGDWTEIGSTAAVTSVNGQTGAVNLTASDIGAIPQQCAYVNTAVSADTITEPFVLLNISSENTELRSLLGNANYAYIQTYRYTDNLEGYRMQVAWSYGINPAKMAFRTEYQNIWANWTSPSGGVTPANYVIAESTVSNLTMKQQQATDVSNTLAQYYFDYTCRKWSNGIIEIFGRSKGSISGTLSQVETTASHAWGSLYETGAFILPDYPEQLVSCTYANVSFASTSGNVVWAEGGHWGNLDGLGQVYFCRATAGNGLDDIKGNVCTYTIGTWK